MQAPTELRAIILGVSLHSALGNAAYVVVVANSYGLRAHMEFTGSYGVLGKKLPLLGSFGRLNGTNLGGGGR